ncbi:NAD(+) synthase [Candidatus Nitrosacidococcus tergens]|uniref:Glutamine-dependent NAD(+) synthetase n=1 Tax=Candidatus Nitrosacidococcus tergens TaxID=553981 RepID=A0A7G1QB29_9GAMM|nr:NAD(+) synthase [Candidatus Nitrosacidococcus tergens]CAB1276983.1 Glutamine-dependent NAD(+) synthetase [Candidatus Nitrosacidococcus tergens]
MNNHHHFFNLYHHSFVRAAIAIPSVKVADPQFNSQEILNLLEQGVEDQSILVVFPELSLSGYSCGDLFQQQALLTECEQAFYRLLSQSQNLPIIGVIGMPLLIAGSLFNCAVVFYQGKVLGVVPKLSLENHEKRQFASAYCTVKKYISIADQDNISVNPYLLFKSKEQPLFSFHITVGEDFSPLPSSSYGALAGAHILINLTASSAGVDKIDNRHQLIGSQSQRCFAAYLYANAGFGESTTDFAWDGQGIIYENGACLAQNQPFSYQSQLISSDIDLDCLQQSRIRSQGFIETGYQHQEFLTNFEIISCSISFPLQEKLSLKRIYSRFPYLPKNLEKLDKCYQKIYAMQVQGLVKRLQTTGIIKIVLGVSGGLDSTLALIICMGAMDVLKLPRAHILAYIMPGFGTSENALIRARQLTMASGCQTCEMDISPSAMQMLKDIGHPYAEGNFVYDLTFENVQAGERTSHLFRLANFHQALVIGTGDLSEMALGWCTYGVGDHMAHYHVNSSLPKTLIQSMISWIEESQKFGENMSTALKAIQVSEISPELIPAHENQPIQRSEDTVGPYPLQDFHLYYIGFGYAPSKVAFLAWSAWHDFRQGNWSNHIEDRRYQYTLKEIKHWLGVFLKRFFHSSQFKRSAMVDGASVGYTLSPRVGYQAPSDSEITAWLNQLDNIPEK